MAQSNPSRTPFAVQQEALIELFKSEEFARIMQEFNQQISPSLPRKYFVLFEKIHQILLSKLSSSFTEIEKRRSFNDKKVFYEMINGNVQEKFFALQYHYENYCKVESVAVGIATRMVPLYQKVLGARGSSGISFPTRKLDVESEAFILQLRSCLDQFSRSVAYYFETTTTRVTKLTRYLKKNRSGNDKAKKVLALFKAYSSFLNTLTSTPQRRSKRDTIAHYERLSFRSLGLNIFPDGNIKIIPHVVDDLSSNLMISQRDIMKQSLDQLYELVKAVYAVIFDVRLNSTLRFVL